MTREDAPCPACGCCTERECETAAAEGSECAEGCPCPERIVRQAEALHGLI